LYCWIGSEKKENIDSCQNIKTNIQSNASHCACAGHVNAMANSEVRCSYNFPAQTKSKTRDFYFDLQSNAKGKEKLCMTSLQEDAYHQQTTLQLS